MKLHDAFYIASKNLNDNPLRTILTLLGIIVGIGFVMTLSLLGFGFSKQISDQLNSVFSSNMMRVAPAIGGYASGSIFSNSDFRKLKSISGVERVIPIYYSYFKLKYKGYSTSSVVVGMDPKDLEFALNQFNVNYSGRLLRSSSKYGAVCGYSFAKSTFPDSLKRNDKIELGNISVKVSGILEKSNAFLDNSIFLPIDTIRDLSCGGCNNISGFVVFAYHGENYTQIANDVKRVLERSHGKNSVSVISPESIVQMVMGIIDSITLFVLVIASISLIVGGVGIANSMFSSILQQTKQVGLIKATGARNSDVFTIVVLEGGLLGFFGGLIGVLLGSGLAFFADFILRHFLNVHLFTFSSIGFVYAAILLVFSFVVGVISALAPAIRASKINPVDALHYE